MFRSVCLCVCLTMRRLHHTGFLSELLQMAATSPWHTSHNPFSHPVSWIQQSLCWQTHAHLLHVFPYFLTYILWHWTASGWCTPLNSWSVPFLSLSTELQKYWVFIELQKGFPNNYLIRHLPNKKKNLTIAVMLVKMLKQTEWCFDSATVFKLFWEIILLMVYF